MREWEQSGQRMSSDAEVDAEPSQVGGDQHVRRAMTRRLMQRKARDSSGAPLPDELRGKFERSLDTDLSGVRIHTGEASAESSEALDARAYATGSDIHFARGEYDPSTTAGQELVAHEVAHTVQQRDRGESVQCKGGPVDGQEREADVMAAGMIDEERTTKKEPPAIAMLGGTMKIFRQLGHPVINDMLGELVDHDTRLQSSFAGLSARADEFGAAPTQFVNEQTAGEIGKNVSAETASKADDMAIVKGQMQTVHLMMEDLNARTDLAVRRIDNSLAHLTTIKDQHRVAAMQRELQARKAAALAWIVVTQRVLRVVSSALKGNPLDLLPEFVEILAFAAQRYTEAEYAPTEQKLGERARELEGDEVRIAARDVELLRQEVASIAHGYRNARAVLEGVRADFQRIRQRAEALYDDRDLGKAKKGAFRFGPLAKADDSATDYVQQCGQHKRDGEAAQKLAGKLNLSQRVSLGRLIDHLEKSGTPEWARTELRRHLDSIKAYPDHVDLQLAVVEGWLAAASTYRQSYAAQRAEADKALVDGPKK